MNIHLNNYLKNLDLSKSKLNQDIRTKIKNIVNKHNQKMDQIEKKQKFDILQLTKLRKKTIQNIIHELSQNKLKPNFHLDFQKEEEYFFIGDMLISYGMYTIAENTFDNIINVSKIEKIKEINLNDFINPKNYILPEKVKKRYVLYLKNYNNEFKILGTILDFTTILLYTDVKNAFLKSESVLPNEAGHLIFYELMPDYNNIWNNQFEWGEKYYIIHELNEAFSDLTSLLYIKSDEDKKKELISIIETNQTSYKFSKAFFLKHLNIYCARCGMALGFRFFENKIYIENFIKYAESEFYKILRDLSK